MRRLVCLGLFVMTLLAVAACGNAPPSSGYYNNDNHGGYPGPGTRQPGRDG
jgi:hypothetical protein